MPHSFGYRARTRDMFKRGFKQSGYVKLSTYMKTYRVGDIVDIKANAAEQKGMPHKVSGIQSHNFIMYAKVSS